MYRRVIWQCNRKFSKTQEQCKSPHLTEDAIKEMFLKAYNRLMRQRKQLIEDCELMKSLLTDCTEQEAGMEQLRQEIEEIADMTQNLVRQIRARRSRRKHTTPSTTLLRNATKRRQPNMTSWKRRSQGAKTRRGRLPHSSTRWKKPRLP